MKKLLFVYSILLITCAFSLNCYSQSWSYGTNKIFAYPDTTKVGIGISSPTERLHINKGALKIGNSSSAADRSINMLKIGDGNYVQIGEWEADDMLSFKANRYNFTNGNVGIGITNPRYKLDVDGKLFLRTYEWKNACAYSYLNWECHSLVMGVPVGVAAVTMLDIMSGGSNEYDSLSSELNLYTAYGENNQVAKIKLNTIENSWINTPGYIGIGTEHPHHKLDVRGAIRADEIYVNIATGADFVFDDSYKLRSLSELNKFVQEYQHLPEIPSANEMRTNGVNMNEFQMQLLQKIEELTLYVIQQEQRIQELENQIAK